jgi:hypothetical protein
VPPGRRTLEALPNQANTSVSKSASLMKSLTSGRSFAQLAVGRLSLLEMALEVELLVVADAALAAGDVEA